MSRSWVVHSRAAFAARHSLTSYEGRPETPHGHHWEVAIRVGAATLNDEHYALDFHAIHALLEEATSALDGASLNDHPEIGSPSPTAERVAEFLADTLEFGCRNLGGRLLSISVWEGPDNRVDLLLDP